MASRALLKAVRLTHLYLGIFIAPAIVFFALSGALQTLGLHAKRDDDPGYRPATWIVFLAQVHKHQTPSMHPLPPTGAASVPGPLPQSSTTQNPHGSGGTDVTPEPRAQPSPSRVADTQPRKHHPVPLRIFFVFISASLISSTVSGLFMAYKFNRSKIRVTILLVAGTILPLLLMLA